MNGKGGIHLAPGAGLLAWTLFGCMTSRVIPSGLSHTSGDCILPTILQQNASRGGGIVYESHAWFRRRRLVAMI